MVLMVLGTLFFTYFVPAPVYRSDCSKFLHRKLLADSQLKLKDFPIILAKAELMKIQFLYLYGTNLIDYMC